MSQDILSPTRKEAVKYCSSCWREDIHKPARFSPFVFGFLLIATLGLVLVVRPKRCVCCGHMRVF